MAEFAKEVWDTLSKIDVSPFVEVIEGTRKRPPIPYLSWHRAWTLLKQKYPASTYEHRGDIHQPDGTVEVEVEITIRAGEATTTSRARLAVMDDWFNAVPNPDARSINDSRQRALVKALAFAGLGLNLWDGSDLPVGFLGEPLSPEQVAELESLIEQSKSDKEQFLKWAGVESLDDMLVDRYASAKVLLQSKIKKQQKEAA